MVSGSDDKSIKLWDISTGQVITTFNGHKKGVWTLLFDGSSLYSGADDSTIIQWDIREAKPLHVISGFTGTVTCIQKKDDKTLLCSAGNQIHSVDLTTRTVGETIISHSNLITCFGIHHCKFQFYRRS
jgi:WD40 repeat protein